MGRHRFEIRIAASPEQVFALYTNLDRMHEWTGGVTRVVDISGPVDHAGTTYTVVFGRMRSPTTVLAAERPRFFKTRFGNAALRGTAEATFAAEGEGTRMTQEFRTEGMVAGVLGRLFALGYYKGSFRGELNEFGRIAEQDAAKSPTEWPAGRTS